MQVNEKLKRQLDLLVKNIESRQQYEKALALTILAAMLVLIYLSVHFDPIRADIQVATNQINNVERQIQAQRTTYAAMLETSLEDPNKFANDRLLVISREQQLLQVEIASLAGDLVTPNDMTRLLTEVLERQAGLELIHFENRTAAPLREGVSNADRLLAETGTLNFDDVIEDDVSGQVFEHGLVIQFQGDFFNTLRYLRFLEDITGSFFWDSISFRQLDWPQAQITLEIHTLSTEQGFIGV